MKTIRRFILIFNEAAALLTLMILIISDVIRNGLRIMMPVDIVVYAVFLIFCALFPLSLAKPGLPLGKVLAATGALVVSTVGIPGLIGCISNTVTSVTVSSFEDFVPTEVFIVFIFLYGFNIIISSVTAWEWVEERRNALSQREVMNLERIRRVAEKILYFLFIAASVVFFLWLSVWVIRNNWGRSLPDIGRDAVGIIVDSLLMAAPYIFVMFLFEGIRRLLNRPDRKVEQRVDTMKMAHSCLEKETIQADMEALTLSKRMHNDAPKKAIHGRAASLVMISKAQYRLGDYDKAKESIREALELYEMIVKQEGGDTDATLYLKAMLYDVSNRISGALKDYEQKLDDCRKMLFCLESHPTSYAYRNEKARAHIEMADALRRLGRYDNALRSCDQAQEELEQISPVNPAVTNSTYAFLNRVKAEILLDMGRIDEAEKCASESIELYSGMIEGYDNSIGAAHLIMSKIQSERGNSEKAEIEFQIAEALIRDRYGKDHPVYKACCESGGRHTNVT